MTRTLFKWLTWTLAVPSLVVALLLAAALMWAHSEAGRTWLAQRMEQEVEAALGVDLRIDSWQGNLLYQIEADGVHILLEGREIFSCRRLDMTYNLLALWGGRVEVGRLKMISPRLTMAVALPGRDSRAGGGGSAATPIHVRRLAISDGQFQPAGGLGPLREVSGLNLRGELRWDDEGPSLDLEFQATRVDIPRLREPLAASGSVRLREGMVTLPAFQVSQGPNRVRGAARYTWGRENVLRLALTAPGFALTGLPLRLPRWVKPVAPFDIKVNLNGPLNRLAVGLQVAQKESSVSLRGQADLAERTCRLTGRAQGLDIVDWGMSPFRVGVTGDLIFRGMWEPDQTAPEMNLEVNADEVKILGETAERVHTKATMKQGRIQVHFMEASGPWGGLRAGAEIVPKKDVTDISVDAVMENMRPPASLAGPLAPSRASGKVKLTGHDRDLGLEAELSGISLSPEIKLEKLTLAGRIKDEDLVLSRLSLTGPLGELDAKGNLNLKGAALDFKGRAGDLAALDKALVGLGVTEPLELAGRATLQGRLEGDWPSPGLRLSAALQELKTPWGSARNLEVTGRTTRLGPSALGEVKVSGRGLDLYGESWQSARLDLRAERGKVLLSARGERAAGATELELQSAPPLKLPLDFTLRNLAHSQRAGEVWRQEGEAQGSVEPGGMSIQGLRLANKGQKIAITGGVDPHGGVKGRLSLSGLRLADTLPSAGLPSSTRLDSVARLDGTLGDPRMEVSGTLSGLRFPGLPPVEVILQGSYSAGWLKLSGGARAGQRSLLDVDLRMANQVTLLPPSSRLTGGGVHLGLHSNDLPLTLLEPLLPGVSDLKGLASVDLLLTGPMGDMYLDGEARLDGGSLIITSTGQKLDQLTIRLSARGSEITVRELSAVSGGTARLTGTLQLPRGRSWQSDLKLDAHRFRVSLGRWGEVTCNSKLHLSGPPQRLVLKGGIQPLKANLNTQVASIGGMEDVVILKAGQAPPSLTAEPPRITPPAFLARARIDTTLDLGQRLRVELNEGWLEATGKVTASQTPNEPLSYHGKIKLLDGRFLYEGRAFKVRGGELDFAGKDTLDPELTGVGAELIMGRSQVLVVLSGTARNPKVQMTSEPPMSQADILSTIIFGQPASALNQRQYEVLSSQALAILGLKGRSELERLVGRRLAPDVVTVQRHYGSDEYLEAGKYLSDDLYLRYRRDTDQRGGQGIGVEFRLNPYLSLESQWGDPRETGVDVTFTLDF